MLARIHTPPAFAAVDSLLRPRLWATAWTMGLAGPGLAENTVRLQLRHLDNFYTFCDLRFGTDALDNAISQKDSVATQLMLDAFYLELTAPGYNTTAIQCWGVVCGFVRAIGVRFAARDESWLALGSYLDALSKIRRPATNRFKFVRALPDVTLVELLDVCSPGSDRNPFRAAGLQLRNWLIFNLLLLGGLRRSELLLLTVNSLKNEFDPVERQNVYWLDVTTAEDEDNRSTRPSIKTRESHRQIPVSDSLAMVYERYLSEARVDGEGHGFLLTARDGEPLSAESVNKVLEKLGRSISERAMERFHARSGGKQHVSPHDLRHTCATARFAMFMQEDGNRELALQRMRAFFGWTRTSDMPELYARAAIEDDLLRHWRDLFDERLRALREPPV